MKIRRKVVNQLLLTESELQQLMEMVQEAKDGKVVHASERRQPDGSYFGIAIDPRANDPVERPDVPRQMPPLSKAWK